MQSGESTLENKLNTTLIQAIEQADLAGIKRILTTGADVNAQSLNNGRTALMLAALHNDLQLIDHILQKNVDVNLTDNKGFSALMLAANYGHLNVVECLVQKGADINLRNKFANTALMLAAEKGYLQLVEYLFQKGAKINLQNTDGFTPLLAAAQNNHLSIVQYLLKHGANTKLQNAEGGTALMFAAQNGHLSIVENIVKHSVDLNVDINMKNEKGNTALIFASFKGDLQIVECLLNNSAEINLRNDQGCTALMFASLKGNLQLIELLLRKGADINLTDNAGCSALVRAAQNNHDQLVEYLLRHGANLNTALMLAKQKYDVRTVEYLVQKNANIILQNNDHYDSLMLASYKGNLQLIEDIFNNDDDMILQNKEDSTALILAAQNGHLSVVEYLFQKGANIILQNNKSYNNSLMLATYKCDLELIDYLLQEGANINSQNAEGCTALMLAANYGHLNIVDYLVQKGAKIALQNNKGGTALMFAAQNGYRSIVENILQNDPDIDANINMKNEKGNTALMLAAQNGYCRVVDYLFHKQANINSQNNKGFTALMIASFKGNLQLVDYLAQKGAKPNLQNTKGFTALMLATQNHHHEVVASLLSKGADINLQDTEGFTALMFAVINNDFLMVKSLSKNRSKINLKDTNGFTALMLAAQNGHYQIVVYLIEKGGKIDLQNTNGFTTLMLAAQNGHYQIVVYLLEKGAKINLQNTNGFTALMLAAQNGHYEIVKCLFNKGGNISMQDKFGNNALFIAANHGYLTIVDYFLNTASDISFNNPENVKALMITADGHPQLVEHLFKKFTNINSQQIFGYAGLTSAPQQEDLTPDFKSSAKKVLFKDTVNQAQEQLKQISQKFRCIQETKLNQQENNAVLKLDFGVVAKISPKYSPFKKIDTRFYLSAAEQGHEFSKSNPDLQAISFNSLKQLRDTAQAFTATSSRLPQEIKITKTAALKLNRPLTPDSLVAFIMAGRKLNAHAPVLSAHTLTRVVFVVKEKEYLENNYQDLLQCSQFPYYDFLVIRGNHAGTLNNRRAHALIAAHHCNLKNILLLDDNIEQLYFTEPSLDAAFETMKSLQGAEPICSLPTFTANNRQDWILERELGCKIFMLNMQLFREKMTSPQELLAFFPEDTKAWGEDYFMQIFSRVLLGNDEVHGYKILTDANLGIKRLEHDQGAFLKKGGKKAEFIQVSPARLTLFSPAIQEAHQKAIFIFNTLLCQYKIKMEQKLDHIEQAPIETFFNRSQNLLVSEESAAQEAVVFYDENLRLSAGLNHILTQEQEDLIFPWRSGQRRALETVHNKLQLLERPPSQPVLRINTLSIELPTGYGKTLVQGLLAFSAYKTLRPSEYVTVICHQISLVEQTYKKFIEYQQILHNQQNCLSVPYNQILPISSDYSHLFSSLTQHNTSLIQRPNIFIICQATLQDMLQDEHNQYHLVNNTKLFIADESHITLNPGMFELLIPKKQQSAHVIAFSATPPQHLDPYGAFTITREQAIAEGALSPLIMDRSIDTPIDEDTLLRLLQSHQIEGTVLRNKKGLIFANSIKEAQELERLLKKLFPTLPIYSVFSEHAKKNSSASSNDDEIQETSAQSCSKLKLLAEFNQNPQGIMISVDMLKTGVDLDGVFWAINMQSFEYAIKKAKNPLFESTSLRQMIGRILRLAQGKRFGLFITQGHQVQEQDKVRYHGCSVQEIHYESAQQTLQRKRLSLSGHKRPRSIHEMIHDLENDGQNKKRANTTLEELLDHQNPLCTLSVNAGYPPKLLGPQL